eukprot:5967499-Amphidinium_carterae.1
MRKRCITFKSSPFAPIPPHAVASGFASGADKREDGAIVSSKKRAHGRPACTKSIRRHRCAGQQSEPLT